MTERLRSKLYALDREPYWSNGTSKTISSRSRLSFSWTFIIIFGTVIHCEQTRFTSLDLDLSLLGALYSQRINVGNN
jgi:hypothetical protein